jgi:redox-sensitive bicupin YhaK (pirin superfamily)
LLVGGAILGMAQHILYRAADRGHFDFGWLNTHHLFSFGEYYAPNRMGFTMLRVFNDDVVVGGSGFGTHPHRNMEIISIPLEGVIIHRDSMGHEEALHPGEVQVMSAGTGITHSEFNGSATEALKFLQIWIIPQAAGVEPRYDQKVVEVLTNQITPAVGPRESGLPLWIHQQAWLSLVKLDAQTSVEYALQRDDNGVFVFVVGGELTANGQGLSARDSLGITDASAVHLEAVENAYAVVIDVPMTQ